MSIKSYRPLWAVIILNAIAIQPVLATPQQDFEAGVQSFKTANYAAALAYFQRAEAEGLDSDQLKYNLGSVYYKLQQYQASRGYFESLIGTDAYRGLAYYNLGLIENKLDNRQAAIGYFEQCQQSSRDEKLQRLAQKQINTLNATGSKPPSSWFAYLSLSYGEDSNISPTASDEVTGLPSSYTEALGLLVGSPWNGGDRSVETTVSYYSRDYSGGGQYDNGLIHLAVDYRQQLDNWDMKYGLRILESDYAEEDFLRQSALRLSAKTGLSDRDDLKIKFMREDISSLSSAYSYLDGDRTRLSLGYGLNQNRAEYRYDLELEDNDRRDSSTQNYSPRHRKIAFKYLRDLTEKWRTGAALQYRVSDYDAVASQQRNDKRIRGSLTGEYRIVENWKLVLKLEYTDNQSSVDRFNYHRYLYSFGLNALFR